MKQRFIITLAALVPVIAACNSPENGGGGQETTGTPEEVAGHVLTWTTTADAGHLFEAAGYDFDKAGSMSPYVVNIDKSEKYQTVDGFGAAITGATCYNLMHMAQEDRTAFLKHIFYKSSGLGSSLIRISIRSSDFPASGAVFTWCDTDGP